MRIFFICTSGGRVAIAMLIFCALLSLGSPYTAAQTSMLGSESSIEIEPRYPKPGQEFIARVRIYSDTVQSISWTVDGVSVAPHGQQNEIRLTAPATLGRSTRIVARAETSGAPITLERTVTTLEVDVVIEGNAIAPYFYEGRRVPGPEAPATAVVIPHIYRADGTRVSGEDLSYTWSINNVIAAEGIGLDRFTVPTQRLSEASVRLLIESIEGRIWYETVFQIPRAQPQIIFYQVSPLTGLSRNAIQDAYLEAEAEATVRAEPYFIDRDVYTNAQYAWSVNGSQVDNQSADPQLITLRGDGGGASDIGFSIRNLSVLSQYAAGLFRMAFN